jgi:DNA-binding CsgD family transcriptional regulator/DNA polymerase III delta prime subunit
MVVPMLVGREAELELVASFVRGEPRVPSPVLLFSGEPGVGKTALLDAASEIARDAGRTVLRATALEFEADFVFGALNQILHPLLADLPLVDEVHQRAISTICGLAPGEPPSQLLAGSAALALLERVAESTPLLIVVDDVPWLDLASAMVFAYVARRLGAADVRLVVAARSELENVFVRSGFEAHILQPLPDESADALLRHRFPALPTQARRRVRAVARGNPLALLDLPAALDAGSDALPETLPLTRRLVSLYERRLLDLPPGTRQVLLFVVLAGAENSTTIEKCIPTPEGRADLPPAERAGVVRPNPRTGHMEFRHPLIRSAVIELSTSEERRRAHAALAEAFRDDPIRRAWHLGQSAVGPDDDVARLLEAVSADLLSAGNGSRATAAMIRSAELSASRSDRARRVARAAYLGSLVTGDLHASPRMLADAEPGATNDPSLEAVTAVAYQLLNAEGDASTAHRLLLAALEARQGPLEAEDGTAMEVLLTLVFVGFYAGREQLWQDIRRQLARVTPQLPEPLALFDGAFADPARAGQPALRRLEVALDGLRFTADPLRITRTAAAGAYLDRLHLARDALQRVVEDAGRGEAVAREIEARFLLANDDYFSGRWDDLIQVTDEGLRLCDELGYSLTAAPGRFLRAMVDASRGQSAAAESAADQLLLWAAPRRLYTLAAYASHVRCVLALADSKFETAYRHAASVTTPGVVQPFLPHAVWITFDLVEAASRSGRQDEAVAHVRAIDEAGLRDLSPRIQLLATACGAMVDEVGWREQFERALATPGSERWTFDRARVHLVYGEQLHRARSATQARSHLSSAVRLFEELGARPWRARAAGALRAAGGGPAQTELLTPQEAAVARLAATGLTNKEIAAQLYLSPRTVSTHLSRVFPKLDISSRAALRDALARHEATLRH